MGVPPTVCAYVREKEKIKTKNRHNETTKQLVCLELTIALGHIYQRFMVSFTGFFSEY